MFVFALLVGIYSYLIFFLGVLGWLYEPLVVWVTVGFGLLSYKVIKLSGYKVRLDKIKPYNFRHYNLITVLVILLALQAGVNLIGVLGPERGFDALWYHLTLPKLYLINHSIDFIPGGLLYYSAMPKLGEMLYTAGLVFGDETVPKFIHFSFGLLTCLAIYKLSRTFFSPLFSLIAVVIFYSNLVVGWESTSAYIDLIRAFFEVMALWAFVEWLDEGKRKWFILSAIMTGLAITTKLLAIGSLVIFSIIFLLRSLLDSPTPVKQAASLRPAVRGNDKFIGLFVYSFICLLIPLPWFIFSYLHTGNPVYPFFTDLYKVKPEPVSVVGFVRDVWVLFTQASDPVSVVYVVFGAVGVWMMWRTGGIGVLRRMRGIRLIGIYTILAIVVWYFTPRTGGGRFILPYLPALSILCAGLIHEVWDKRYLRMVLVGIVVLVSLFSIGYRFAANSRYLPVIIGKETKQEFLSKQLHFDFGDFYDIDGYFAKTIKQIDRVLLYGFHNLYYVDFPFVDASWVGKVGKVGEVRGITYIAVQNGDLPEKYKGWKLVYENKKTMVKLYRQKK